MPPWADDNEDEEDVEANKADDEDDDDEQDDEGKTSRQQSGPEQVEAVGEQDARTYSLTGQVRSVWLVTAEPAPPKHRASRGGYCCSKAQGPGQNLDMSKLPDKPSPDGIGKAVRGLDRFGFESETAESYHAVKHQAELPVPKLAESPVESYNAYAKDTIKTSNVIKAEHQPTARPWSSPRRPMARSCSRRPSTSNPMAQSRSPALARPKPSKEARRR